MFFRQKLTPLLYFLSKAKLSLILVCLTIVTPAAGNDFVLGEEDTMLMFVGENLEILSIASRREESAWQAPAVAQVVTRKEFRERGARTLSEVLENVPGFYMAKKEWGSRPYLRGIPDSVLFLFDTIPVGSDITKFLNPVDWEMSLAPVKRIEIVRGPGSVLWGPDAYAGIVNIVPITGKDFPEAAEIGVEYGMPRNVQSCYLNMGLDRGVWDAVVSMTGRRQNADDMDYNVIRFWDDPNPPADPDHRYGIDTPGRSRYFDLSGRLAVGEGLTFSSRIANSRKSFTVRSDNDLAWKEARNTESGFLKIEGKKSVDMLSVLRFTGAFSFIHPEYQIVDQEIRQKENTLFGELIYDRSVWTGSGLLTGGLSYREKEIRNAPYRASYLPDYLRKDNLFLVPSIPLDNHDLHLFSVFGQYNHKMGDFDIWGGVRYDRHDDFKDHLSYNMGSGWSPSSRWMLKIMYGTAYRTPIPRQLAEEEEPDLENIRNLSLQIAWEPTRQIGMVVCGFINDIDNHIMEDPYAGLSEPNHQKIKGIELSGHYSPTGNLDFSANLTLMENSGPDETYRYQASFSLDEHGMPVKTYEELQYDYDSGPDTLADLICKWEISHWATATAILGYQASGNLIYPRNETNQETSGVWLLDVNATFQDLFLSGLDMEVSLKNVFDKKYETPGTYNTIKGDPVTLYIGVRKRW